MKKTSTRKIEAVHEYNKKILYGMSRVKFWLQQRERTTRMHAEAAGPRSNNFDHPRSGNAAAATAPRVFPPRGHGRGGHLLQGDHSDILLAEIAAAAGARRLVSRVPTTAAEQRVFQQVGSCAMWRYMCPKIDCLPNRMTTCAGGDGHHESSNHQDDGFTHQGQLQSFLAYQHQAHQQQQKWDRDSYLPYQDGVPGINGQGDGNAPPTDAALHRWAGWMVGAPCSP
ncbi:uncharacterized protein LOC125945271 [Dermacentor silvarum]|uniref:uncharacterized protein LOC125945271 n=1 Tax=Dermacentor silvarum TaxID=543639 RepID=UPI002100C56B|nr:uncharacterized protein LOC125945271 [Dermacentor silvarum]